LVDLWHPNSHPNNEPEQLVTVDLLVHHIPTKHEKKREPQVPSIGRFMTSQ
jgi:hypothetical protein